MHGTRESWFGRRWRTWRDALVRRSELSGCGEDEVERIAQDIGVSAPELREIERRGPGSADLLPKMMTALELDAGEVAAREPTVMRDLQRVCSMCEEQGRCAYELADGTAKYRYAKFCPNAETLDALNKE
jgi:hypothetical protein